MEQIIEVRWQECRLCQTKSRPDSTQWVWACQCPQPVHRYCLQKYVWRNEIQNPAAPSCSWCGALFCVQPAKGIVVTALEKIAYSWYPKVSDFVSALTVYVVSQVTWESCGFLILSNVYGFKEAWVLLMDMSPWAAFCLCNNLPYVAIVINYIPWEDYFLRCLRSCSRLPVLGVVMPRGGPEIQHLKQHSMSMYEAIIGGFSLPYFAKITGQLLFSTVESQLKSFLLGGAFFIVVRGMIYMYYRQKTYIRQKNLAVANYVSSASATNGHE